MLTDSIFSDLKHYFRYGNMVVRLIFINVGIYLVFLLLYLLSMASIQPGLYNTLSQLLSFPASPLSMIQQPWSLFSYMFTQVSVFHLLFNMVTLYWFGEMYVMYMTDKKVLQLYLIGGLMGALFFALGMNFIPALSKSNQRDFLMGSSASVFAFMFAATTINPDYRVKFSFLGTFYIKYVAIGILLLSSMMLLPDNTGGFLAHIGGALSGYLFIKLLQKGIDISSPFTAIAGLFKRKSPMKVIHKNVEQKREKPQGKTDAEQEKLNEILDKISRSGYNSLNNEERDFLFRYSKK